MSKNNTKVNDSTSRADRRLVLSAVGGLLLGAGGIALVFSKGGPITTSRPLFAQVPTVPGIPGRPTRRPGNGNGTGAPAAPPNSFTDAPAAYKQLQGGGGGATSSGGLPPGGIPGASGGTGATSGTAASKPAPIKSGATAQSFRKDPFVSYRIQPYQKPPAYTFLAPDRLAPYPQPPKPKPNPDPNIEFGPLPYVPRRVAGVLLRGQVSAILETGGIGGDTQLVRPGSVVPSGIAGVPSLTVASITPTQLTLRAPDGRTVSVDLSASPTGPPAVAGGNFGGGPPAQGGSVPRFGGGGGKVGAAGAPGD